MTSSAETEQNCTHCQHVRAPEPRVWRGNAWYTLGSVLLAGLIAVPMSLGNLSRGLTADQALGILAAVGLTIAGAGAYLRALAHQRPRLLWVDHVGKLLNVMAVAFAFWATTARLPQLAPYWSPAAWWLIGILMVLLIVAALMALLRPSITRAIVAWNKGR